MPPALAGAGLLAAGVYFVGLVLGAPALLVATKALPVAALIVAVLRGPKGAYPRWITAGLTLAMIGDLILLGRSEGAFMAGLVANLIAHLVYVGAFLSTTRRPALVLLVPYLVWTVPLFLFVRPGLGGMAGPVAAYTAAITAMMWRAGACVGHSPRSRAAEWSAALGAMGFALCDSILAVNRFHTPLAWASYVLIAAYWLGQWGIARSAYLPGPDPVSPR
jgi:alkenylglycerophosphocholine/alkenylglycerophosphoethanolamine hydrolase